MNQKDIENNILREMFGDDSRSYPGFHGIVSTLIENGSCITTETARRMDFFCMNAFIGNRPYKGGVGLIEFYFSTSREEVVAGAEFKRRLIYKKRNLGSDLIQLQLKMDETREEYDILAVMLGEE